MLYIEAVADIDRGYWEVGREKKAELTALQKKGQKKEVRGRRAITRVLVSCRDVYCWFGFWAATSVHEFMTKCAYPGTIQREASTLILFISHQCWP